MDNTSFAILQLYSKKDSLSISQLSAIADSDMLSVANYVYYLKKQQYLQILLTGSTPKADDAIPVDAPLAITLEGKIALEAEIKARKNFKNTELRAWITLIIAVSAFALSIVSLCLQYI